MTRMVSEKSGPDFSPEWVRGQFAAGGGLPARLPGYSPRPEQAQLAEKIAQALAQTRHCLAEAGTGVGKTLSYLVPGIAWALQAGERLLISTHTKALQAQLMKWELPRLVQANLFGQAFRFEMALGAENYVCLSRLLRVAGQESLPGMAPAEGQALLALLDWCRGPVSGARPDAPVTLAEAGWRRIAVVTELCQGRRCSFRDDCFLRQARQRQKEAQVIVTNHHLYFSNLVSPGCLLPECGAVILDEAHKLEDVAVDFLGDRLAQTELSHWLSAAHAVKGAALTGPGRDPVAAAATAAKAALESWWRALAQQLADRDMLRVVQDHPELPAPPAAKLIELSREIEEQARLAQTENEEQEQRLVSARLREAADILSRWYARNQPERVYWTERLGPDPGRGLRIHATPLEVSHQLRADIFATGEVPVILTSATLAVAGDFSYVRSRLGVDDALEIHLDSPFDYAEQAALYLPEGIPDPRAQEAFETAQLDEIRRLLRLFGGGLFVLFTSHRFMRSAAKILRHEEPGEEILVQGEAAPVALLERFRLHRNAVMLGVETFWQGVDVPGEALRCVVITRLPFDMPAHPLHQARMEYLAAQGENAFMTYSLPRAVLMLRQGFGRLIRRPDDRGVVAILDPRIRTRSWGRRFLDALPPCSRLSRLGEVEKFVRRHFGEGRN